MRDLRRDRKKQSKLKNFILNNIYSNLRYYIIVMIILIIGIACGVIFINNINEEQKAEISKYINDFISSLYVSSPNINFPPCFLKLLYQKKIIYQLKFELN